MISKDDEIGQNSRVLIFNIYDLLANVHTLYSYILCNIDLFFQIRPVYIKENNNSLYHGS